MIMLLMPAMLMAQEVTVMKQRKFPKTVSAGNYSGITWLGGSVELPGWEVLVMLWLMINRLLPAFI